MINNEKNGTERINLRELNECIEKTRSYMLSSTNYDFLEQLSKLVLQKIKVENTGNITPVVLFAREEAMSIVLNFFNSLGNTEWYEQAKSIILGQNKNIEISIFREENVSDFLEKNEDGLYKYSYGSQIEQSSNNHKKAIIRVSLNDEFLDVNRYMPKDKFTIEDIYSIVHEISHTFDLGNDENAVQERQLFAEMTSFCFEGMLSEYLINNNIVNERIVDKIKQRRMENTLRRAKSVWGKVNLIKLKEKEKTLTKENIKQMLDENGIKDPVYVQSMLRDILTTVPSIDYEARYPIGMLTAYEYMKMYKKDKKQAIEKLSKYCESIKRGDTSDEVLKLIGCPMNLEEIETVINDIRDDKSR